MELQEKYDKLKLVVKLHRTANEIVNRSHEGSMIVQASEALHQGANAIADLLDEIDKHKTYVGPGD